MFMSISTNYLSMIIGMCIRRCGTGMRIFRMCIIGMGID